MKKGIALSRIVELFNKGLNTTEIGEELGCTYTNVWRRLKKVGINFKRDYSKRRLPNRINKHKIDLNYFEIIDTQDKAYFLGLLYSDGSVTKNQFYIKLKDEDIILKFKDCLKCDYPILYREFPYKSYCLTISSQKMCNDLINLGCVPNKTKIIRLPKLKEDLYRHFIRGFFDGDGCLRLHDKIYHCSFDLACASKKFLEDLRPLITAKAKTNGCFGKESKYDVWHLRYGGHQVQQILDWLYENANCYLKRKYVKYKILSSL